MAIIKYIVLDDDLGERILEELTSIKKSIALIVQEKKGDIAGKPMDVADVMRHLNISRRTIYNHLNRGLTSINNNSAKKYFWKKDVDEFLKSLNSEE